MAAVSVKRSIAHVLNKTNYQLFYELILKSFYMLLQGFFARLIV